jgi:puromycin-sensitive aminopeptidase
VADSAIAPYRLPRSVLPDRYELTLTPDLGGATFAGEERVTVRVVEPVAEIALNAIELQIHTAELASDDGRTVLGGPIAYDEAEERATIDLGGVAEPGVWHLHLTFTGILNDKLHGFYRSTFRDEDGVEQVIATTQFEATDARRAFPCWDEPDFKAGFAITLIIDDGLTAISNGPVVEDEELANGKRQLRFAETMSMSTYLVAFVVGPFVLSDPVDVDGIPLRVACIPGREQLTAFALETGAAVLRFFGRYFGIPYPAAKLDHVAIPDFAFGAMENLGCVTYRETALLVDLEHASRVELERVAQVVAHETAHMWFGDLVTMKWWNGIWLNEAFATFMELLATDDFRPQWQSWVSFGLSRAAAMVTDGLATTRPVEFHVGRPEEAEGMFDVLTYQKGAAVVRMLEQYLGAEPFRLGIARYLDNHRYDNTETTDLWDAIEASSGEPARALMDSWIFQGGYPLVSVEPGPTPSTLTLSQAHFRYLGGGEGRWQIPVGIRASVAGRLAHRKLLLTEKETTVDLGGPVDWVVVNEDGWGFYRVRYESALREKLTTDLSRLSPLERFSLVSDTWAAVLAGRSPVSGYLGLARLFVDEDDPDVRRAVMGPLGLLNRCVGDDDRPRLAAFVRELAGPAFARLGWTPRPGEDERTGTGRADLLSLLGTLGDDKAIQRQAADYHRAYLHDRSSVPADLVDAFVAVVAHAGGEEEHETFLERFEHAATPQDEVRYLFGLARFQDPDLLLRTLELCLSGRVRTQNAPYVIEAILAHRVAGPLAWAFVEDRWDEINERFPDNSIPRMLEGLAVQADENLAARARAFLDGHPVRQGEKSVAQTLERMDVNGAFRTREAAGLPALLPRAAG